SSATPELVGYGPPGNAGGSGGLPSSGDDSRHRDIDELQRLEAVPRACAIADDCPVGSHCDDRHHICQWECLSDTACDRGLTCDLLGQCVRLPRLYVSNNVEKCLAMDPSVRLQGTLAVNSSNISCDSSAGDEADTCPCGAHCTIDDHCFVECVAGDSP